MSKHFLNANSTVGPVALQMGWDKPMQMFYCVIMDADDKLDEPIYSNLNERKLKNPLDYYVEVCKNFGIVLPEEMIGAILVDQSSDTVNQMRIWN